ncbi:hypothetical protein EV177_004635 [Coemansia sp. RSA 1804]|nr:hypothetical protein EV177_004635 [Coemansia sp. RSA 1804]
MSSGVLSAALPTATTAAMAAAAAAATIATTALSTATGPWGPEDPSSHTATLGLLPTPSSTASLLAVPSNDELLDCKLVGGFSILVQVLVGTLGFSTLMIKRHFERPQRTWTVWAFDVSKQMISGGLMHMANLLVSALSGGGNNNSNNSNGQQQQDAGSGGGGGTNPCSWYVLNLTMDCTVGILFVALYLRLFERLAAWAGATKGLESGDYGTPPDWRRWAKQATIFCASMVGMKLSVVALIALFPALVVVGDVVLKPVQMADSARLQIVFVMAFWPLVLNIFESWVLDQFIKRKLRREIRSASGHMPLATEDDADGTSGSAGTARAAGYEMAPDAANTLGSSGATLVGSAPHLSRHAAHLPVDMADIVMPSPAHSNLHSIYKMHTFSDDDDSDGSGYGYDYAHGSSTSSGRGSGDSVSGSRTAGQGDKSARKPRDD